MSRVITLSSALMKPSSVYQTSYTPLEKGLEKFSYSWVWPKLTLLVSHTQPQRETVPCHIPDAEPCG